MKKKPPLDYKAAAKALKKLGIVGYDLRKPLTPSQKGVISRKYWEAAPVINSPDLYVRRTVNVKTAKRLSKVGIGSHGSGKKRTVYVKRPNVESKITIRNGNVYTKDYKNGLVTRTIIYNGDIFQTLSKMKLKKGELLTAQFGNHGSWNRKFDDINSLLNYIANKWPNKDDKFNPQQMIAGLSIVKIIDEREEGDNDEDGTEYA